MAPRDTDELSDKEIDDFVSTLDKNNDGHISYTELEHRLDAVYEELMPNPKDFSLTHPTRRDDQRHEFLRRMMGEERHEDNIPVEDFKQIVRSWKVPSLKQSKSKKGDDADGANSMSLARRLRARWDVRGPEYVFLAVVVSLQLGLGIWQCLKYALDPNIQAAFGWGVALAKFSAGALYPTLFFLILSMSRWYSTFMRKSYYISRFVNWDRAQSFHIKISIAAIVLATLHIIGHLSGTFVFGSSAQRQPAVANLLGQEAVPRAYSDYVRSLPGWSGLTAISILYIISLLSMPIIRKKSYEIFQLGHLLMFPFIGVLMAHGGLALLQYPVLGFVLAFPTVLVIVERTVRTFNGFHEIPAELSVLDDDTVCIKCQVPERRIWNYEAGQWVFLQVPQLSLFQWHPFTISTCVDRTMELHIKTDGDWTGKLRDLTDLKYVGIDGPFGAPAQRFYDFDQTIIVGAGIGVTPFSGILTDLQHRKDNRWKTQERRESSVEDARGDRRKSVVSAMSRRNSVAQDQSVEKLAARDTLPAENEKARSSSDATLTATAQPSTAKEMSELPSHRQIDLALYRRVDFHWIVRDKNYLNWFSSLLNTLSAEDAHPDRETLDIRLQPHVTQKREDMSQHIYRWMLEQHRTPSQQVSPLTGLVARTEFGRPDFDRILDKHYGEMLELFSHDKARRRRVGVFFCGSPVVGETLADLCRQMTLRGREDGSGIEYHFMIEVFG